MARFMRWLGAGCLLLFALGCIAVANAAYAGMLLWTFAHAESAAAGWLALGVSPWTAFLICTLCSTIDIAGWVYLSGALHWLFLKIGLFLDKFSHPALRRIKNIVHRIAHRLDEKLASSPRQGLLRKIADRAPYSALPLCGFVPGWIWTGVILARIKRLNPLISFVLIALGNAGKMAAAAFGTHYAFFELHKYLVALKR